MSSREVHDREAEHWCILINCSWAHSSSQSHDLFGTNTGRQCLNAIFWIRIRLITENFFKDMNFKFSLKKQKQTKNADASGHQYVLFLTSIKLTFIAKFLQTIRNSAEKSEN